VVQIAYLVPGVGLDEAEKQRREEIANDLTVGTVTVVEATGPGPSSIESSVEDTWSAVGVLRTVWEIKDQYDAIVIGCFGDPGLRPARELVDAPIVGPCEATLHTAIQIGDRFTWLTILDATVPKSRARAHELGLEEWCVSVRSVDAPVESISHESQELVDRMVETGRNAVEEDGAEVLIPGCMSLAFMQVHDEIESQLGVPFLDPASIALEQAAVWGRHGISQSTATYPSPKYEKLDDLLEAPDRPVGAGD
jgi:allantoin racemase